MVFLCIGHLTHLLVLNRLGHALCFFLQILLLLSLVHHFFSCFSFFYRMRWVTFSLDLPKQITFIFEEKWMLENLIVRTFFLKLVEVVHVQLADEWWEVVVFEVLWQYLVGKQIWSSYLKAISALSPAYNFIEFSAIDDLIDFHQKRWNMIYRRLFVIIVKISTCIQWLSIIFIYIRIGKIVLKRSHGLFY